MSISPDESAKKKILIADDDKPSLKILEAILVEAGYIVIQASDGKIALRLARSAHPDVVVLDIAMPGMDGIDVGLMLKSDPLTRRIPVIFLSSRVGGEFKEGMDSLLSANFLPKPVEKSILLTEIERVLGETHSN